MSSKDTFPSRCRNLRPCMLQYPPLNALFLSHLSITQLRRPDGDLMYPADKILP
jgi:hypothetical protein